MDFERAAIALILILSGFAVYRLYGWLVRWRISRSELGLEGYVVGKPAIVYFTDPACAPCRTVQDPALEELAARYGSRLQIIKIQALERQDLANSWGVLSLPTTFIVDARGQPRGVNHGVARASRLTHQLAKIGVFAPFQAVAGTIDSQT